MWSPRTHRWEMPLQEWSGTLGWASEDWDHRGAQAPSPKAPVWGLNFAATASFFLSNESGVWFWPGPQGPSPLQLHSWPEPSPTLSEKDPSALRSTCGPRCDGTTSPTSARTTKKLGSAALEVSGSCLQLNTCCARSAKGSSPACDPVFVALRCARTDLQALVCRAGVWCCCRVVLCDVLVICVGPPESWWSLISGCKSPGRDPWDVPVTHTATGILAAEAMRRMEFPVPYPTSHVCKCWNCRCGTQSTILVACQPWEGSCACSRSLALPRSAGGWGSNQVPPSAGQNSGCSWMRCPVNPLPHTA